MPSDLIGHIRSMSPDRITVSDALDLWIEIAATVGRNGRPPVSRVTHGHYRQLARAHLRPMIGSAMLSDVDTPLVARLRTDLLLRTTRSNACKCLANLRACLDECRIQGLIDINPAYGIIIETSSRERPDIIFPSRDEARAMLCAADALAKAYSARLREKWQRYRVIVYVLRFTGMRISEVLGLPWTGIDEKRHQLYVMQTMNEEGRIVPPKSKAADRIIDIAPALTDLLLDWRPHCPSSRDNLAFPTPDGRAQRHGNFAAAAWPRLSKVSGMLTPDGKPLYNRHAFRHLFASELIDKGATLKELQTIMGHSRPEFTVRYYGHLLHDQDSIARRRARAIQIAEENWPAAEDQPMRQFGDRHTIVVPVEAVLPPAPTRSPATSYFPSRPPRPSATRRA